MKMPLFIEAHWGEALPKMIIRINFVEGLKGKYFGEVRIF
jgi:hypothetical protein